MVEIPIWWWLVPFSAAMALLFAFRFHWAIMKASPGDARMQEVAGFVREGAFAYLRRQYKVVAFVFAGLVVLLAWQAFGLRQQHILVPFAFLTSGLLSGLAGFIGMYTATRASSRTTEAVKQSLDRGLQLAFRGGAVMGLVVVGLALLDISFWFWMLAWLLPRLIDGFVMPIEQITVVMLSFAMGASTQALFARVGGGIFTKSADVAADLVGKVESGIPEDDPRNPAVIADNVGDNVGDVAGMGADLYESYYSSLLAAASLGAAAAIALGLKETDTLLRFVATPMMIAAVGILVSIAGIHFVRTAEQASQANLLKALRRGVWGVSVLILVAAALVTKLMLPADFWLGIWGAVVTGLAAGVVIGWSAEYCTSTHYEPTRWLSSQCRFGPATTIINGLAYGMLGTWGPLLTVSIATVLAFHLAGGFHTPELGLFGVGIAAVGMLSSLGITLATDACGPIADNAGGNAEMTQQPKYVRERTDALDSLGNTTAAAGKGFAIGSAALTALALLTALTQQIRVGLQREATSYVHAHPEIPAGEIVAIDRSQRKFVQKTAAQPSATGLYPTYFLVGGGSPYVIEQGHARLATDQEIVAHYRRDGAARVSELVQVDQATLADFMEFYEVHLMNPRLLSGMFLGALIVFVFCGLTMRAVGKVANRMVDEVRRQFRELDLLDDPHAKADYARCVRIATAGAQSEMVLPALLAVLTPIAVGVLLDVSGLMGLLGASLVTGFATAVFMANSGGAWDNAKKYIEAGHYGGKGSEAHKAAVVGDTVGDPFKDTSGPSLNILIKLMSIVALTFAGVIVKYGGILALF